MAAATTNKDETISGQELYPDPPGRAHHSIYSPWGEESIEDPCHQGNGTWQTHLDVRFGTLGREFSRLREAAAVERRLLKQNFSHEYESRAALLSMPMSKSAARHLPESATLQETVRRVLGK